VGLEGSEERFGSPDACVGGGCGHETVEKCVIVCIAQERISEGEQAAKCLLV
jgi:hypothetical protein